ncbi:MAG: hypothetical protein LBU27_05275 [Candidatus Peribacteria bacterium]|jgi:GTP-binding protein|nr:hypothetical protein [Candidatus Peribacteria bacterium]
MTQHFLKQRKTLKKLFLLIDGSIPPQKIDLEMIASLVEEQVDFALVFTKMDKGTQKERSKNLKEFQQAVKKMKTPLPDFFQISNVS